MYIYIYHQCAPVSMLTKCQQKSVHQLKKGLWGKDFHLEEMTKKIVNALSWACTVIITMNGVITWTQKGGETRLKSWMSERSTTVGQDSTAILLLVGWSSLLLLLSRMLLILWVLTAAASRLKTITIRIVRIKLQPKRTCCMDLSSV